MENSEGGQTNRHFQVAVHVLACPFAHTGDDTHTATLKFKYSSTLKAKYLKLHKEQMFSCLSVCT